MDKNQYREWLRMGLGRATLYAQSHDMSGFREVILDACLHCYAHEPAVEGTRAGYMYDLVATLPDREFYHQQVLKALPSCGDDWDAVHRFVFVAYLESDGSEAAKRAMIDAYNPGPWMAEKIGVLFLHMDGIDGFLFAAEKVGALLQVQPDEVDEWYLLSESLEINSEQETWNALQQAGATNPQIETYRQKAKHRIEHPTQHPRIASLPYTELRTLLPLKMWFQLWKWGEKASYRELSLAAQGLIEATDPELQHAHLAIFDSRPFPLAVEALFPLLDVEQARVDRAAARALTQITHPSVRALAFRLIETQNKLRREAIAMLASNYSPGDHRIVLRWFRDEADRETRNLFGMALPRFWNRHPDPETEVEMLLSVYESAPSSFCREQPVRRLIELGALPDAIRAECAWDANSEIQALVQ